MKTESAGRRFAEYWRETYESYLKDSHRKASWRLRAVCYPAWPLLFNRVMSFFEFFLAGRLMRSANAFCRGRLVLDLGCGTARWCEYFQRQGARVVGIDLFPEVLQDAQERLPAASFAAMSATHLGFRDGSVDFVSAAIVLQHLPRTEKAVALNEIKRVLKPGGWALVLEVAASGGYWEKEGDVVSKMRPEEWRELFSRHHFTVLEETWLHAYPLASLHRAVNQRIGMLIKTIKGTLKGKRENPKGDLAAETQSVAKTPSVHPPTQPALRHRFYRALDQAVLTVIAAVSFPLEFIWLVLGRPGSHKMFLVRKAPE